MASGLLGMRVVRYGQRNITRTASALVGTVTNTSKSVLLGFTTVEQIGL